MESRWVFSASRCVPRTQVHITIIEHAAEQQRHPAAVDDLHQIGREEGEIDRRGSRQISRIDAHSGQRHRFHTTTKASAVVVTIVPVTAMP